MDFDRALSLRGFRTHALATALILPTLLTSGSALGACGFVIGSTVTCSTATTGIPFSSTLNGLNANVTSSGQVSALLGIAGTAMTLTGNNTVLNNAGVINPNLVGLSVLNNGVVMGNSNASTITVNNLAGGIINGTTGASVDLLGLSGTALRIQNGAGGVTNINNAGTIGSNVLLNVSVLQADTPQIAVYGGSQINMINTGIINGRVGFQASAAGNSFVNAGTINGSVNLGAGGTNTFTAITGSTVSNGGSSNLNILNIASLGLGFAQQGVIDGGAGGNNTLILQNALNGGSGISGSGIIDGAQYINFGHLQINSGTWTLLGTPVSGSSLLSGGLAIFNSATAFGSGVLTSNGGAIQAGTGGLTLGNAITLNAGGLTTQGSNDFGLSGVINGSGPLIKTGSHTLTLSGSNNYSGGTTISAGGLLLGADLALGTGALNVTGASNLSGTANRTLANAIALGNTLTLNGNNDLTLNGAISGSSGLIKNGSGTLGLNGAGSYQGGLQLNAGTLNLGSATALGTGVLTVGGASNLTSSSALSVGNSILLNNNLTVNSPYDMGLNGALSGTGQLVKSGTNNLTLSGLNAHTGGTLLNGGTVTLAGNGTLGTGTLTVAGNANLDSLIARVINNTIALNAALGFTGTSDLTLNGAISGSGSLVKNGSTTLTLNNASTYSGGTTLNAGGLILNHAAALGSGALTVAGTGTLDTGSALLLGNAINLGNTLILNGSNDLTLNGTISGGGGLVKNAGSTLTLGGNNTFTGGTTLNGGTLSIGSATALGSGVLSLGGSATLTTSGDYSLGNALQLAGNTLTVDSASHDLSLGGIITGSGSLTKTGAGSLTLNGNNSYSGGTNLTTGVLRLGSDAALGSGTLTVSGDATLDSLADRVVANAIALNASLGLTGTRDLTLGGTISGSGSLLKNGSATLTLNGNNTYSGGTNLNSGSLIVGSASALGSGQLNVTGAAALDSSSAFDLSNAIQLSANLSLPGTQDLSLSGAISGAAGLIKSGTSTLSLSGGNSYAGGTTLTAGRLALGSDSALGIGGLTVTGDASLSSNTSLINLHNSIVLNSRLTVDGDDDLNLNGIVSGSGSLIKQDSGTLALNAANSFSGGTTLGGGTLSLGNAAALGSGLLSVDAAASLLNTQAMSLGNAIELEAALSLDGSSDLTLAGTISGSGSLIKNSAGILTLAGNNSFSGGTSLNSGTLTIGHDQALGSGSLNVAGNATLTSNGDYSLNNAIDLGATLIVDTTGQHLTLAGVLDGSGGLSKVGNGSLTLSASNTLSGVTSLDSGTLILGDANALGSSTLNVTGAANLDNTSDLGISNDINLDANLTLSGNNDLGIDGVLSGTGNLLKSGSGTLTLNGDNSGYAGTLTINDGVLQGNAGSLTQAIVNNALLSIEQLANGTYAGSISGTGSVDKNGDGTLTLSGSNSFSGGLNVNAGNIVVSGGSALSDTGTVNLAAATSLQLLDDETLGALTGSGTVIIDAGAHLGLGGNGADSLFAGSLTGAGGLDKVGSGTLTLSGDSTLGSTQVNAGTLNISGNLNSDVSLFTGATLSGSGSIDGAVSVNSGAVLSAISGQTLTTGDLNLDAGASLNLSLGAPSTTSLIRVNGDLTLDGTLNVTGLPGFGLGEYRLIDYTGALTDNGLALGTLPASIFGDLATVQTGLTGQVNLIVESATSQVQYWNPSASGTITGGAGTWDGSNVWVNQGGVAAVPWSSGFGIFSGTGATVDVIGAHAATGLQFAVDGYRLAGGSIVSTADSGTGNDFSIRVNPGVSATIDSVISGTGGLNKRDDGTLILNGINTYSGDTTLSEGVLQVSAESALGDGSGAVSFNGGTLRVTGTDFNGFAPGRTINWQNGGGSFDIADAGNTFSVSQVLGGTGTLSKLGDGSLLLSGANTYSGGTTLAGGSLLVAHDSALGSGTLNVQNDASLGTSGSHALGNNIALNAGATLSLNSDSDTLTLNGLISGLGALEKSAGGTLLLNHANAYVGGTTLNAGTLGVGNDLALGLGLLTVNGDGSADLLASNGPRTLANLIQLNANLNLSGTDDLTLNGLISGNAGLIKQGTGDLTLNGLNTYTGGTTLAGGTLTVGNNLALGSGVLNLTGDASLDSNTARTLSNDISLSNASTLTLLGNADFTLGGVLSGNGGLFKEGTTTLRLAAANSYSGGTTLAGGTLLLEDDAALGSGALTVDGASTLDNASARTLGNAIELNATLTLPGSADLSLGGPISGSAGLIKQGNNPLTLNSANTYTGDTELQGGSLLLGNDAALGSGELLLTGNATLGSTAGNLTLQNSVDILLGKTLDALTRSGETLTFSDQISGGGTLSKSGAGTLVLAAANTFTGGVRLIDGGSLVLNDDNALGSGLLTVDANTQLSSDGGVARSLANAINLNAALSLPGSSDFSLNGAIHGSGALIKNGTSNLTLNGSNAYSGGTTLAGGSLTIGNDNALGSGALNVTADALLLDNGAATLNNGITLGDGTTLTVDTSDELALGGILSGTGALDKQGSGVLALSGDNTYSGGTLIQSGSLLLGHDNALGSAALSVTGNASLDGSGNRNLSNDINLVGGDLSLPGSFDLTLAGSISGNNGLLKQGDNSLTLSASNTYSGGTELAGGTLLLGNDSALGTGTLSVSGSSTLDGNSALTLNNAVALNSTLLLPGSFDMTLDGALSGAGTLIKQGAASLTLSQANGGFTGSVGLQGGSLLLADDAALGSANIDVTGDSSLGNSSAGLRTLNNAIDIAIGKTLDLLTANDRDITLNGTLSGAGILNKSGAGSLNLSGVNSLSGETRVTGGALVLGNDQALGTSALLILADAELSGSNDLTLGNDIYLGGDLQLSGSNDLTLDGTIGGSGVLLMNNSGTLTLNGHNNNFNGIQLNAGNLAVSTDTALGTGPLSVNADASLSGTGNLSLNNAIELNGSSNLSLITSDSFTLGGVLSGTGSLTKSGSGELVLNNANSYSGGTALEDGLLILGDDLALGSGQLTVSGNGSIDATAVRNLANDIHFTNDLSLTVAGSNNLTLAGDMDGNGRLIKDGAGSLTLSGINSYSDGTQINAGTLYSSTQSLPGDVDIAAGARLEFSQDFDGSYGATGEILSGSGTLAKSGSGVLTLVDGNSFAGLVDIIGGTLQTQGNGVISNASQVNVDGNAVLGIGGSEVLGNLSGTGVVDLSDAAVSVLSLGNATGSSTFAGAINGVGSLNKVGGSTLILSGASSLTGPTSIQAGTLQVDGSLDSASVSVGSGATLTGVGNLNGAVSVADGGTLAADQTRGTLSLGELNLSSGAQIDLTLGAPAGATLIDVAGDLVLDGTLNITDAGDMGLGVYRLFTYSGQLTNSGLTYGVLPAAVTDNDYGLQTGFANQINLLIQQSANQILFWNGSETQPSPGSSILGGSGIWGSASNWTDATGEIALTWGDTFAVFGGRTGTDSDPNRVLIDGSQSFIGMQFLTDGYVLEQGPGGGNLIAVNGSNGTTDIRVDASVSATIDSDITGTGRLNKLDGGTLILGGDNSYSGGTRLGGGVLQVDADNRLGDASGDLQFAGGTLRIIGTDYNSTNRVITLDGAGTLDIADADNSFALGQSITGSGPLIKLGDGVLQLNAANTYGGGTILNAGTLSLGDANALGSGSLSVSGGTLTNSIDLGLANTGGTGLSNAIELLGTLTLDGAQELALTGVISGTGALVKNGSNSTLELTGLNSYSGGTDLNAGTLIVNSDSALGSGTLRAADATRFDSSHDVTLVNEIELAGNLDILGSNGLTLNGVISGSGGLTKEGSADLTLGSGNTYSGGTTLNDGTLVAGANNALGSGPLVVNGGSLDSNTAVTLDNAITLNVDLGILGSDDLVLAGDISGNGGIQKNGSAELTLSGNNSYSGDTQLNQGTLTVGSDTALGSGQLDAADATTLDSSSAVTLGNDLTLNGELTIAGSNDLTLNGLIDGAGSLNKAGSADLTLNQANSYSGGTTLTAGSLTVGDDAALGSGNLNVTGDATLDSNRDALVLGNDIDLQAELTNAGSHDLTLSGNISGSGSLVKNGSSTLTLSGDNSYSGGTTLNAGSLSGNSDSLVGDIFTAADTSLIFDQGANGTYAGDISGSGTLIKDGIGNLTLSGNNSYSGGTLIDAGTLTGDSDSLQGDIQIGSDSTLVFDQNLDGTFAGALSGAGDLIKQGNGDLSLTGNSTIGGTTTISNGSLLVEGSLSSDELIIQGGGALGGGGSINGDVTFDTGARLVAGTYLTPLSFSNDLNLTSGTTLDFRLGIPNSPTALVSVGGNLTLDGTLDITNAGGLGVGIYRLFEYAAGLTDNGLDFGNLPLGYSASNFSLQTGLPGQVNLLLESTAGEIQFWDGGGSADDGIISGGSGTWNGASANWTDAAGNNNAIWNERFAAFAGDSGTVLVDGNINFTGLQFLTDGYVLSDIAGSRLQALADASGNAPRIIVDNGVGTLINVGIDGSAGLVKAGAGTLTLAGDNNYTGDTQITGGTLVVGSDDALGDASSNIVLDGGVLGISGTTFQDTDRDISLGLNGGGFDIQTAGHTFTLEQALSGSGGLVKRGDGTLLLAGDNSYTGGTLLQGGRLTGDTDSLQGIITTSAGTELLFDQLLDGTFVGEISGGGTLIKDNNGHLTLSGNNSYTGGTTINAGRLIGDAGSLQGDIAITLGGALEFAQGSNAVFNGMLSGGGALIKSGAGSLLILDNQQFTGSVEVDAGSLIIGDASAQTHRLDANINVSSGAQLSGTGTVNNLVNSGTVAPGYSGSGTLNVTGAYSSLSSSRLLLSLVDGQSSRLAVGDSATLAGTLQVQNIAYSGSDSSLTLITANNGVSGTFDNTLLPNFAFLDASVNYNANSVTLDLARNGAGLSSVATTPNQNAVAGAIERAGGGVLYNAILGLDANEAADAYDQLSGEIFASSVAAAKTSALQAQQAVGARMRQTCQSTDSRSCSVQNPLPLMPLALEGTTPAQSSTWAYALGGWGHNDGDDNSASMDHSLTGMMFGYDRAFGDAWRAGVTAGYSSGSVKVDERRSDMNVDAYHLGIYGRYQEDRLSLRSGIMYSWQDVSSKRDVAFSGFTDQLKADYDAHTLQLFGEAGYLLDFEAITVEPYVNLSHTRYETEKIKERGGAASLESKIDQSITTSTLGVRGAKHLNLRKEIDLVVRGGLGWQHTYGDDTPKASMVFADSGASFNTRGTPVAKNAAVVEAGVEMNFGLNSKVQLTYAGQIASDARNQEMRIEFSHRF